MPWPMEKDQNSSLYSTNTYIGIVYFQLYIIVLSYEMRFMSIKKVCPDTVLVLDVRSPTL